MAQLQVDRLTKRFGGLVALNSVDFAVNSGEVVGLIGPNGAGKTTLFNVITGFIKPDSGSITYNGEVITGLKPHDICRRGVVRTFQLVKPFVNLSVLENVTSGALLHTNSRSDAEKMAEDTLKLVGLSKRKDTLVKSITLVERKWVEVARALATRPKLLLLDELYTGLNPSETEEAKSIMDKVRKTGVTLVVVEHVMSVIMTISDRIVVIDHGEKIAEGKPEEIVRT